MSAYLSLQEYVKDIKNRTLGAGAGGRRQLLVPVVHIPKPQIMTITQKDFDKLVIDPAFVSTEGSGGGYQRGKENRVAVGILRDVLRRGGTLPPIHVCSRRKFASDDVERHLLFVVDGRHRCQACIAEGKRINAFLYQFASKQDEALFFQIQTGVTPVDPNIVIAGSSTTAAQWLRDMATDTRHPMCGRISFDQGRAAKEEFRASTILPCLLYVASMSSAAKAIHQLERVSNALEKEDSRARLDLFVRLLAAVFPGEIYSANALKVMAHVAKEKWENAKDPEAFIPRGRSLQRLVRLNWSGVGGGASAKKWWILAESEVRRCWK